MTDLKDILHQDEEMNQEELLRYLEGNATPEERFAIENRWLIQTLLMMQ